MAEAKQGDKVKVHYKGTLDDGTIFDSSEGRDPLEFTIGDGNIIPGFEEAVIGMNPGESKSQHIPAEQAYGPKVPELVAEVEREQIPPHINPEVGQQLQIKQDDGQVTIVTITDVNDKTISLDANHPLAGKNLTFEITLVEVA